MRHTSITSIIITRRRHRRYVVEIANVHQLEVTVSFVQLAALDLSVERKALAMIAVGYRRYTKGTLYHSKIFDKLSLAFAPGLIKNFVHRLSSTRRVWLCGIGCRCEVGFTSKYF